MNSRDSYFFTLKSQCKSFQISFLCYWFLCQKIFKRSWFLCQLYGIQFIHLNWKKTVLDTWIGFYLNEEMKIKNKALHKLKLNVFCIFMINSHGRNANENFTLLMYIIISIYYAFYNSTHIDESKKIHRFWWKSLLLNE